MDFAAISKTIKLTQGSFPDAYNALINDINAKGGIDGRKIIPYFAPVDPIGTAPAAAACTQLTEDDHVFVALGFFQNTDPLCYLDTHGVNIIGADDSQLSAAQQAAEKATWFDAQLTSTEAVPKEIDAFYHDGLFAGRKVAVLGTTTDVSQINTLVLPELKKLGVPVVQTAVNDAPPNDTAAANQQTQIIVQKLQSEGVNLVVGVGNASAFPQGLQQINSSYHPRLLATNLGVLNGVLGNQNGLDLSRLTGTVAGSGAPADLIGVSAPIWNDPLVQNCVAEIKAAFPADTMADPATATSSTGHTWVAPESACQGIALLEAILKAAGKNLNNQTFLTGGESLKNIVLPGSLGPLNYGPGHHDGNGPVFIYTWDPASKSFKLTPTSA